ncbi:MAG: LacI family transcriptional regulator, partial [Bacteroidetes bacterium]
LIAKGHVNIAFLGAEMDHPSMAARLEGFRLAISKAAESFNVTSETLKVDGEPDHTAGQELSAQLFALEPVPTAVFCVNDAIAFSVLELATERGIKVPEELAVIGFDDVPRSSRSVPPLTTVRVHKEQMGELALRYLSELLENEPKNSGSFDRGSHNIQLPAELILRQSA